MATRTFRARPLDTQRPLEIVRDESLLDAIDGPARDVVHNHQALDADNEKPKMVQHGKGGKEIPTPITLTVESYALDYLPTFHSRNTYIRGKGGVGFEDPTFVEYDLDSQDFEWLATLNGDGQARLSPEKLEMMLWKLDLMNAEATDKVFSFQGSAAAERRTAQACATTDHLQKQDALQMLEECCPSRDTIREAVYSYWKEKRSALGRPLLRRLQAPTPQNNTDPYKVFRSRERPNRPQTRRRRENNADSLDKLTMIADNIKMAMELFELIVRRERKKRDLMYVKVDEQQLEIRLKQEPKPKHDTIEKEYLASAKSKSVRRPVGFENLPEAASGATNKLLDFKTKKEKKKKALGEQPIMNAVSLLDPPVLPVQEKLMPSWITPSDLENAMQDCSFNEYEGQPRLGRYGRVVIDRCNPFTMDIGHAEEPVEPLYKVLSEDDKKHFAEWSSKVDLANKAYQRVINAGHPKSK